MNRAAIILAAGAGTRMKSNLPKVLHEVAGKPLVSWVIQAAQEAGIERIACVVGYDKEAVVPVLGDAVEPIEQKQLRGTADAVRSCADAFADYDGSLVVLSGDCPLITPETICALMEMRESSAAAMVVLTMQVDDPFGYGRIVRDDEGNVLRIVEQKDATTDEAAITECNSGFYCFDARALFEALSHVNDNNAQGEFYLTDVLEICRNAGRVVTAYLTPTPEECQGVNTQEQLSIANHLMMARLG